MRVNDALTGIVLLLFAVAMLVYTTTFPAMPGQDYGSALFPRVLGIGMIGCAALLIVHGMRERQAGWVIWDEWAGSARHRWNLLIVVAAPVVYILVSDTVGFIPTAFAILLVLLVRLGTRPLAAAGIALATAMVVHQLFARLLLVPLPWGWLEPIVFG